MTLQKKKKRWQAKNDTGVLGVRTCMYTCAGVLGHIKD